MEDLLRAIWPHQQEIYNWLEKHEHAVELPLYSSVDIRDGGFKAAVVDTNLFPAGFNNLCEHGRADAWPLLREALVKRVPDCKRILIIAEEHTRNTWYLENVRILAELIQNAGFDVKVASFLYEQPKFCEEGPYIDLTTATGKDLRIYCVQHVVKEIEAGTMRPDMIILNNDLTTGVPEMLKEQTMPIYPSLQAGWHARLKSYHFQHTADLMQEFANLVQIDPWFFSCLDEVVADVNINEEADREKLADAASDLFKRIAAKYDEHGINEKPFIFLKADSGSYGMGVMPFENARDIASINRKKKNKLYKGKNAKVISRYLLQEGIPSVHQLDDQVAEVCIYQVDNGFIGGFYRIHGDKSSRENLNSKGMTFKTMCPHNKQFGECGVHTDQNRFDIYRILSRVAGIAAHREIQHLETAVGL